MEAVSDLVPFPAELDYYSAMCGIAGFLSHRPMGEDSSAEFLRRLLAPVLRRGPDSSGLWTNAPAGVGLAHSRLAIIDLSPTGHQPMQSRCGRYQLTFNGEIYNFAELKSRLKTSLRGRSDTEVLLETIAEHGIGLALSTSEGMFAFALWDNVEETLTLARDRLGEKPLYYGISKTAFLFGSEPGCMPADPDFDRSLSKVAITEYFSSGVIPRDLCIYENAKKLPPGHFLTITRGQASSFDSIRPRSYWKPALVKRKWDPKAAVEALDQTLSEVISQELVADTPVGVFLSGGIDSSLVTAYSVKKSPGRVKTFTIAFQEQGFDESGHAEAVAAALGTEHTCFKLSENDAIRLVPEMAGIYQEPFSDSSQVATTLLSRVTAGQVKVALSGDGGDELFLGYNRHTHAPGLWNKVSMLPFPLRAFLSRTMDIVPAPLIDAVGRRMSRHPHFSDKRRKLQLLLGARDRVDFYKQLRSVGRHQLLLHPTFSAALEQELRDLESMYRDGAAFFQMADILDYLPNDILVKVDRASMSQALETRSPFLHPRIVDLALSIPQELNISGRTGKILLRECLARHLPAKLFERPKTGFSVPVSAWLKGPLKEWADALLLSDKIDSQGILNGGEVRKLWKAQQDGSRESPQLLWSILQFQSWLENNPS